MPNTKSLVFHHMGLLTDEPELAALRMQQAGYRLGPQVFDPLQLASLRMCEGPADSASIELVTPHANNTSLRRLLERRGDYMYHICFAVSTFTAGLAQLSLGTDDRIVVLSEPKPALLFDNSLVAFYVVPGLGLVELLECL